MIKPLRFLLPVSFIYGFNAINSVYLLEGSAPNVLILRLSFDNHVGNQLIGQWLFTLKVLFVLDKGLEMFGSATGNGFAELAAFDENNRLD